MAIKAVVDTHAGIWYLAPSSRLSQTARVFIDTSISQGNQSGLSAITLVELVYLIERDRIPMESLTRLSAILAQPQSPF